MITESEARHLERLCAAFSSLTEENKEFILDVSKALLTIQSPRVLSFQQQGHEAKRAIPLG
jgi:hypothetical protein